MIVIKSVNVLHILNFRILIPFYVGAMARVSIKIIPKILDTTTSAPDLLRKWRLVYRRGHIRGPAIGLTSSLFYVYAAYAKKNLGIAPNSSFGAAFATALMLPYTWIVMATGVNQRLLTAGTAESKGGGSTEEVRSLIEKWAWMNLGRAVFPLLGGLIGLLSLQQHRIFNIDASS